MTLSITTFIIIEVQLFYSLQYCSITYESFSIYDMSTLNKEFLKYFYFLRAQWLEAIRLM